VAFDDEWCEAVGDAGRVALEAFDRSAGCAPGEAEVSVRTGVATGLGCSTGVAVAPFEVGC